MKYFFLTILLNSFAQALLGQDKIYDVVDKQAEFKGGGGKLLSFVSKNLKYPDSLGRTEFGCGRILIKFTVEKDGTAKYESCETTCQTIRVKVDCIEVKKMIAKMPKWKPAEINGKKVRCRYNLPIHGGVVE